MKAIVSALAVVSLLALASVARAADDTPGQPTVAPPPPVPAPKPAAPETVAVPKPLFNAVLNYMAHQPWVDVRDMMPGMIQAGQAAQSVPAAETPAR